MTPAGYQHIAFLRRFRVTAYWLVLLSMAAFAVAEPSPLVLFIGAISAGASWWIVERPKGKGLPRWMINLGVLFGAFLLFWELVMDTEAQGNLLQGLGHFMVAILICKLFESKQSRDYAQILTLSLLIMVAGAFFLEGQTSPVFGVLLAAYMMVGIYAIVIFHLRTETERAIAAGSAPAEITMPSESQKRLRKDVRRMALRLGLLLMVFASMLFVIFPRSGQNAVAAGNSPGGPQTTGFGSDAQFHEFTHLLESDAPAMEVSITVDGVPYKFENSDPYFRGVTYDAYDLGGHKWALSEFDEAPLAPESGRTPPGAFRQEYHTLVSMNANVLFSLAGEPGVAQGGMALKASNAAVDKEVAKEARFNPGDYTIHVREPTFSVPPTRYSITTPRWMPPPGPDENCFISHEEFLNLPDPVGDGRYFIKVMARRKAYHDEMEALLLKVLQDVGGAARKYPADERIRRIREMSGQVSAAEVEELAQDIAEYLRRNCTYSLTSTFPPNEDPVKYFLQKGKEGHCEYFASAMVLLLRVGGINARMVAGYHGGEYEAGRGYLVRQKDAHAWVEVMVPGKGWRMYDPTPAGRDSASAGWGWVRSMRDFFRSLQAEWMTNVSGFDAKSREELFAGIHTFFAKIFGFVGMVLSEVGDFVFSPHSNWQTRVSVTVGVLFCAWAGLWLHKQWRYRRRSRVSRSLRHLDGKTQRQLEHELRFFDELMMALARTGVEKTEDATPREYVESLSAELGTAKDEAIWLVNTFYAARFGMVRMTAPMTERVGSAMSAVRAQVAAARGMTIDRWVI